MRLGHRTGYVGGMLGRGGCYRQGRKVSRELAMMGS